MRSRAMARTQPPGGSGRRRGLGAAAVLAAATVLSASALALTGTATATATGSIDLSIWELQEPNGNTISPSKLVAGYSDTYVTRNGDGSITFTDSGTNCTPTDNA